VTEQLPPSKFGKGYTYGGADHTQANSQFVPPPANPAAPPTNPVPPQPPYAGFSGGGYPVQPPVQNPYVPSTAPSAYNTTPPDATAPPPFVNPYGVGQPTPPAWIPSPQQAGQPAGASVGSFFNSGEGAPKTAALLSIVGGLWAAFTVIERGNQIKYLFKFFKYASHLPAGSGWYYITVLATIAEIVAIPLLLAAGYMLWQRNPNSLRAVLAGNGVVLAANLILAVAVNKAASALTGAVGGVANRVDDIATRFGINPSRVDSITGEYTAAIDNKISSLSSEFIIFHLVLPAVLAIIALILARSIATKLWVHPMTGYAP
jgi:hypothetical protein